MGLIYNTGPYNAAAKHFGADDSVHTKLPRQSFQFSIQFILNENVAMGDDSFGRNFRTTKRLKVQFENGSYVTFNVSLDGTYRIAKRYDAAIAAMDADETLEFFTNQNK